MQIDSVQTVLEVLNRKQFDSLRGLAECEWLEVKQSPYILENKRQKAEFAKDVTALANASGGLILLGFDTERHPTTASERISEVKTFPLRLAEPDRYMKTLTPLLHPMPHVRVLHFEELADSGNGVAAIEVEAGADGPYLVGEVLDETEKSMGVFFGYFQRRQDVIPPLSVARIQQQLSAGRQWVSLNERLSGIEAMLMSFAKSPQGATEDRDKQRKKRLATARTAIDRDASPIFLMTATPEGHCDFPTLFASQRERVVGLIENPPELRPQGFAVWAAKTSKIIDGEARRNLIPGQRLIELWKDGFFAFIGPGDEDLLGWRMYGFDKPIHISNFVLTELVLHFCWLVKWIFQEANPRPSVLKLTAGFQDLQRPTGLPTLSDIPEGKMRGLGSVKTAKAETLEVHQLADMKEYEPERVAYLLLADMYVSFGFNTEDVPYTEPGRNPPRISAEKIIGKPLPQEPPAMPGTAPWA